MPRTPLPGPRVADSFTAFRKIAKGKPKDTLP
jgi:hypothetical protein